MKKTTLLLLFLLFFLPAFAKHIIGGDFTYRCLGDGNYEFTLIMYRDCSSSGAPFDNPANIAVYLGSDSIPVIETLAVNPQVIEINPEEQNDNPCITIPPGVCVQQGVYTFTLNLPSWPADDSYHIVYQRCCRNDFISNIQNSGNVGATFAIEITPESQDLCNNSPIFDFPPLIILCNNQPINFQHSATDEEGDQIIYELCEPLLGAGPQGGPDFPAGNPFACDGIVPSPPCPPPFAFPDYVPPYTAFNPLPADPPLSIDATSGQLSGTPTALGQYVVAICAKEYRNGELLSTIRREFQFNVASCDIDASITLDLPEQEEPQHYLKESCEKTVNITNSSIWTPGQDELLWQWQVQDTTYTSQGTDFSFTFPDTGHYSATFYINPASQACSDTAWIDIIIYPEAHANFSFTYDTCIAGPVSFEDLSATGAEEITAWLWNFGDSLSSTEQNPQHEYYDPGDFPVQLHITDNNGCTDSLLQNIPYYPAPAVIVVSPDEDFGCIGSPLFFENQSYPIDETYRIFWDFGDGATDTLISPYHTYWESGTYDIYLSITSPWDCFIDTVFPGLAEVFASPRAGFTYTPQQPSNFEPEVQFTDTSYLASHWLWYVNEDPPFSTLANPVYVFADTGIHRIQLIAITENGCRDTAQTLLDVVPQYTFFMPNAFSPNFDRLNDFFQPAGIFFGLRDYRLEIRDRYGELVFTTQDLRQGWNGSMLNTGRPLPPGSYLYHLEFTEPRGKKVAKEGMLVLIR